MAKLSLDKEVQKVKLSLEKNVKKDIQVQMKFVADVSGSMAEHYRQNGYMYPIMQKSIALASVIDPDKVVQVVAFSAGAIPMGEYGVDSFETIWEEFKGNRKGFWGNTVYSEPMKLLADERDGISTYEPVKVTVKKAGFFAKMFGAKDEVQEAPVATTTSTSVVEPELIVFFTDGCDNGNEARFVAETERLLSNGHTYIMFIGSGGSRNLYSRIEKLADAKDNVGFIYFDKPNELTDNEFYDNIISNEFGTWINQF